MMLEWLHPEERELLDAAAELREAREHLERVRDHYSRGDCSRVFVQRASDRLATARKRADRAQSAMDAIRVFEQRERER